MAGEFKLGESIADPDTRRAFKDFAASYEKKSIAARLPIEQLETSITHFNASQNKLYFFRNPDTETIDVPLVSEVKTFSGVIPLRTTTQKYDADSYFAGARPNISITTAVPDAPYSKSIKQDITRRLQFLHNPKNKLGTFNLRQVIEALAGTVNESIIYDFSRAKELFNNLHLNPQILHEKEATYQKGTREYHLGTSGNAGHQIRNLLERMNFLPHIHYFQSPFNFDLGEQQCTNDMTTIADISNGHWALVVSKNPFYQGNIVKREDLRGLGEFTLQFTKQ